MKRMSIGLRLTLWYFAFFSLALVLFGTSVWFSVRHSMLHVLKQNLSDTVQEVQRFLQNQPADFSLARLQGETTEEYSAENEGDYLQITNDKGQFIYQAPALRSIQLPSTTGSLPATGRFDHFRIEGRDFLFLHRTVTAHGKTYLVQVGMPLRDVYRSLAKFRETLLIFVPLVLVIASAFGYWISRRALRPVNQITEAARTISEQNLGRRLEIPQSGDELQRLSETLNEMFARLEESFARITRFTGDASHELRTPVSLIRTEAEVAMRKVRTEAEYREALAHILSEADRTTHMIEELLALARADSGADSLLLQQKDVGELLREVTDGWRRAVEDKGLQFVVALPSGQLPASADSSALRRVFDILLDNALRYTPAPGEVGVKAEIEGGALRVDVQDSGIGISAEDLPRIFERFYRADPARNRESGGAGLGLAIAQWIVRRHGGTIEVQSVVGKGSRFTVRLPLATELSAGNKLKTVEPTVHAKV
jgi:two-component system, OmpR family, heavy metal sensor histidine kinase CusS